MNVYIFSLLLVKHKTSKVAPECYVRKLSRKHFNVNITMLCQLFYRLFCRFWVEPGEPALCNSIFTWKENGFVWISINLITVGVLARSSGLPFNSIFPIVGLVWISELSFETNMFIMKEQQLHAWDNWYRNAVVCHKELHFTFSFFCMHVCVNKDGSRIVVFQLMTTTCQK